MDTTHVIAKEELPTYRRWEFSSFDTLDPKSPENNEPRENNEVELPIEEQIEKIYQQAKEKGFEAGRVAGYQEGRQIAEGEVKTEVARIQALLSELDKELQSIDKQVANDLLALALDLAKKMITQALQIHPELVLPIVQEAIRHLPHAIQHPQLILHPDDAILVRSHLGDQLLQPAWEIREDEQIEKGGCRVEASGSEVDASLSTRWQRVLATIGQENNWLK